VRSNRGLGAVAARYRAVHKYTLERQRKRHDVYGWYPSPDGKAVIQVDPEADEDSFPDQIGGVDVTIWKAPAPGP
jgi:hypothetical protein